jgi:hypothetical protein
LIREQLIEIHLSATFTADAAVLLLLAKHPMRKGEETKGIHRDAFAAPTVPNYADFLAWLSIAATTIKERLNPDGMPHAVASDGKSYVHIPDFNCYHVSSSAGAVDSYFVQTLPAHLTMGNPYANKNGDVIPISLFPEEPDESGPFLGVKTDRNCPICGGTGVGVPNAEGLTPFCECTAYRPAGSENIGKLKTMTSVIRDIQTLWVPGNSEPILIPGPTHTSIESQVTFVTCSACGMPLTGFGHGCQVAGGTSSLPGFKQADQAEKLPDCAGCNDTRAVCSPGGTPEPCPTCCICHGCKKMIDPDCCHCGSGPVDSEHGSYGVESYTHPFIPMGCDCYRSRTAEIIEARRDPKCIKCGDTGIRTLQPEMNEEAECECPKGQAEKKAYPNRYYNPRSKHE